MMAGPGPVSPGPAPRSEVEDAPGPSDLGSPPAPGRPAEQGEVKLEGYLEWRQGDFLIVDGQRVRPATALKFKGRGDARDPGTIPMGTRSR